MRYAVDYECGICGYKATLYTIPGSTVESVERNILGFHRNASPDCQHAAIQSFIVTIKPSP